MGKTVVKVVNAFRWLADFVQRHLLDLIEDVSTWPIIKTLYGHDLAAAEPEKGESEIRASVTLLGLFLSGSILQFTALLETGTQRLDLFWVYLAGAILILGAMVGILRATDGKKQNMSTCNHKYKAGKKVSGTF